MKRRIAVAIVCMMGLMSLGLSGCGEEKGLALTKEEASKIHLPLGQPMPPEAKAFMEKATRDAQAKAATGRGAAPAAKTP